MTSPTTPADALAAAAARLKTQREAAQTVSKEIAEARAAEATREAENAPERAS